MSLRRLFLSSAIAVAALTAPTRADTFLLHFSDAGSTITADLVLQADLFSGVTYLVSSISGTVNGSPVSGPTGFAGADNFIFWPSPPNVIVDVNGIGFTHGAIGYNFYEDFGNFPPDSPYYCGGNPYCVTYGATGSGTPDESVVAVSATLEAIPEPTSLLLLAGALGGLGVAQRRTRD